MGGPITDISTFFNSLSADFFFKINIFREIFQEHNQGVIWFGSTSATVPNVGFLLSKNARMFCLAIIVSSTGNQLQTIAQ